jgi:hypothetical protein
VAEGWIFEPNDEVKSGAVAAQAAFAHLDWLRPIPRHFLHVWLVGVAIPELAARVPLELEYARVNCFHSAVVVEVRAPELSPLHPEPTFLPHMTIAVTTQPHNPELLREALLPLRQRPFGRELATNAKRISFAAGRSTLFEPWTVVETVPE